MMNDLTYDFERLIISMSQVYALLHLIVIAFVQYHILLLDDIVLQVFDNNDLLILFNILIIL